MTHRCSSDNGKAQRSASKNVLEKQGPMITCWTIGNASCLAQAALCWPDSSPLRCCLEGAMPAMLP